MLVRSDGQWERERCRRARWRADLPRPALPPAHRGAVRPHRALDERQRSRRHASGARSPATTSPRWYGRTAESRIADPADPNAHLQLADLRELRRQGQRHRLRVQARKIGPASISRRPTSATAPSRAARPNRYLKRIRYGNRQPYFPGWRGDAARRPAAAGLDVRGGLRLRRARRGRADARRRPVSWPVPARSVLHLPRRLRGAHLPAVPARADVPSLPGRARRSAPTAWCARPTSPTGTSRHPATPRNPVYAVLASIASAATARAGGRLSRDTRCRRSSSSTAQPVIGTERARGRSGEPGEPAGRRRTARRTSGSISTAKGISGILTEQGGALVLQAQPQPLTANGTARVAAVARCRRCRAARHCRRRRRDSSWISPATASSTWWRSTARCPASTSATTTRAGSRSAPFASLPNRRLARPQPAASSTSTGDGHADVLITEDDAFTWYPSLAEDGFGPAARVSRSRSTRSTARASSSPTARSPSTSPTCRGDGLTDLVRIRNGEVCYWPNLGYGRFGAKVTMDNAPWFDHPDQFDQQRIRLADIDGSRHDRHHLPAPRRRAPLLQPVGQQLERSRSSCAVFPRVDDVWSSIVPSTCSATAPPAWSGRRRCPAMRGGRCATST